MVHINASATLRINPNTDLNKIDRKIQPIKLPKMDGKRHTSLDDDGDICVR